MILKMVWLVLSQILPHLKDYINIVIVVRSKLLIIKQFFVRF